MNFSTKLAIFHAISFFEKTEQKTQHIFDVFHLVDVFVFIDPLLFLLVFVSDYFCNCFKKGLQFSKLLCKFEEASWKVNNNMRSLLDLVRLAPIVRCSWKT